LRFAICEWSSCDRDWLDAVCSSNGEDIGDGLFKSQIAIRNSQFIKPMSQNQEIIESKLCAYIDGVLDSDGRAEIERHLKANPQHRRLLESLRATRDLIRWLPREQAPLDLTESLHGQLERSVLLDDPIESLRPSLWPRVLAAAAIVILTVGLGAAVFYALPQSTRPQMAIGSKLPEGNEDDFGFKGGSAPALAPAPVPFDTTAAPTNESAKAELKKSDGADASPAAPDADRNLSLGTPPRAADALKEASMPAAAGTDALRKDEQMLAAKPTASAANPESLVASPAPASPIASATASSIAPPAPRSGLQLQTAGTMKAAQAPAELEQLASQVSQNSQTYLTPNQVGELAHASGNQASPGAIAPALVMLVHTDTPDQTEKELTAYFDDNHIPWRQTGMAQTAQAAQEKAALSIPAMATTAPTNAPVKLADGRGGLGRAPRPAPMAAAPGNPLRDRNENSDQASLSLELKQSVASTQPAINARVESKVLVNGGLSNAPGNLSLSNDVLNHNEQIPSQLAYDAAARSGGVYVCQMSRRQAAELNHSIRLANRESAIADVPAQANLNTQDQARVGMKAGRALADMDKSLGATQLARGGRPDTQPTFMPQPGYVGGVAASAPSGAATAAPRLRAVSKGATSGPAAINGSFRLEEQTRRFGATTNPAMTQPADLDAPVLVVIRVAPTAAPPAAAAPATVAAPTTQPARP
jgi:hypothetical protein